MSPVVVQSDCAVSPSCDGQMAVRTCSKTGNVAGMESHKLLDASLTEGASAGQDDLCAPFPNIQNAAADTQVHRALPQLECNEIHSWYTYAVLMAGEHTPSELGRPVYHQASC